MHDRVTLLATAIVFGTGAVWGFYWLPARALADLGLAGAWGTAAITAAAALWLLPFVAGRWREVVEADRVALASIALGGAAFALYSVGFVYGRVALVILLYFLTPVWSTALGRALGWPTPRLRLLAIAVGLLGLLVMLSADGAAPVPRSAGEWMGLVAGLLWSVATTGMRARPALVFALGATAAALLLAPLLEPEPASPVGGAGGAIAVALGAGGLWWGVSITSLMWATVRLEPARVGILLMTEVLVGAASAALWAGERLSPLEMLGGALVLCAGVLEVWPVRRDPAPTVPQDARRSRP